MRDRTPCNLAATSGQVRAVAFGKDRALQSRRQRQLGNRCVTRSTRYVTVTRYLPLEINFHVQ